MSPHDGFQVPSMDVECHGLESVHFQTQIDPLLLLFQIFVVTSGPRWTRWRRTRGQALLVIKSWKIKMSLFSFLFLVMTGRTVLPGFVFIYLFILNDNLIRFSCLLLLLLLLGWPIIHFWIYGLKTLGLLIHNWALSPYSTGDNDDLFYLYSYNLIINDICYFPLQIC